MTVPSPLQPFFDAGGAVLTPYGPHQPAGDAAPDAARLPAPQMVATLGSIEMEYAALRRGCALLDLPIRAVLIATGPDRLEFLNRMVTQELKGLAPGNVRRSFWLNRKGRIDADLRIIHLPDRTLLELDVLAAAKSHAGLSAFIISEDCALTDASASTHRLALHGPTAGELLDLLASPDAPRPSQLPELAALERSIAGVPVVIYREDTAGVPGFELIVPSEHAVTLARALIERGHDPRHTHQTWDTPNRALAQRDNPNAHIRLTLIGWHAYNLARIEAGTPLFHLDFGMESLPAETGVLHERVSFTKGCYLGQEVVARMHARQQVKQQLVCVRFAASTTGDAYTPIPDPGSPLLRADTGAGVGTITSAAPSPRHGMAPVAFAQVKPQLAPAGTVVQATAEGVTLQGVVQPTLKASDAVRAGTV